jgi:hypothetical protein
MKVQDQLLEQIKKIYREFLSLRKNSNYEDLSDLPDAEVIRFNTRARALIPRVSGDHSIYTKQCEEIIEHGGFPGFLAKRLFGVIDSLKADVQAGYLESQKELIHAELFSDFLEMAQHLLDEGFKDASAVIAGSSLEAHLRQLATKARVKVETVVQGRLTAKKAERLNSDLANAGIYSKLDQKSITAWLDLRNKAAHGHYDDYEKNQVLLMISGIRDFVSRNPA